MIHVPGCFGPESESILVTLHHTPVTCQDQRSALTVAFSARGEAARVDTFGPGTTIVPRQGATGYVCLTDGESSPSCRLDPGVEGGLSFDRFEVGVGGSGEWSLDTTLEPVFHGGSTFEAVWCETASIYCAAR